MIGNVNQKEIYFQKLDKIMLLVDNGNILTALRKIIKLYKQNPHINIIKLRFAELLILTNKNREKAKKYLNELLNTESRSMAILTLGKLEFSEGNIDEARKYFSKLFNKKNSNASKLYLGRLEALEGNYNTAKELFIDVLNSEKENKTIIERTIYGLIELNISYEKYLEALFYLDKLINITGINTEVLKHEFYLKYKLGLLNNINVKGYFNNQVLNYSIKSAMEHVQKRHSEFTISMEELFEIVKNNLGNLKKCEFGLCDKYLLNLGYTVGKWNNIETSVIKIITLCNTANIITTYPTTEYCNLFPKEKVKSK